MLPGKSEVRDVHRALRQRRFAHHAIRQLSELQKDTDVWQEYLSEADETHVADGVGC